LNSGTGIILLTCALICTPAAWAASNGGHACGARVKAPLLGAASVSLADTGDLVAPDGGQGADLIEATVPGVLTAR